MIKLENSPQGTRDSVIDRIPIKKYRTLDANQSRERRPVESFLNKWQLERELSEGLRAHSSRAIFFSSLVPMLMAADAAVGGDAGGEIALLICIGLTLYLFSLTGWKNEKP